LLNVNDGVLLPVCQISSKSVVAEMYSEKSRTFQLFVLTNWVVW